MMCVMNVIREKWVLLRKTERKNYKFTFLNNMIIISKLVS